MDKDLFFISFSLADEVGRRWTLVKWEFSVVFTFNNAHSTPNILVNGWGQNHFYFIFCFVKIMTSSIL